MTGNGSNKIGRASANLEEQAGIEALDGSFTAMPLAQVDFTIPAAAQKLHKRNVPGVYDFHGAGYPLQTQHLPCLRWLCWR